MEAVQEFWADFSADIYTAAWEHVFLVLVALALSISIGLPVGILLTRIPQRVASLVLGAAGVVQTIPSLALVALIMIVFILLQRWFPVAAIGKPPAIAALVLYALLPILRNTYTGIRQVDSAIIEVARGMGMRKRQILLSVELPLALPFIMAGVRISTVWTIGVATLTALIGAGGLGDLIIQGLQTVSLKHLFAGMVPAALLAVVLDTLLGQLENWLTPAGVKKTDAAAGGGA